MKDNPASLGELFYISLYESCNIQEFIENNPEISEVNNFRQYSQKRRSSFGFSPMSGGGSHRPEKDLIESDIFHSTIDFLKTPSCTLDSYCPECLADSVFEFDKNYVLGNIFQIKNDKIDNKQFCTSFMCTRCRKQRLLFLFELDGVILKKIAQFPSQMDLLLPEVKIYQKELGEYSSEFYKAIGLHASGIGVGAFVYLRRIFEKLIFDTYTINGTELMNEDKFGELDMSEKIDLLSEFLPAELVDNRSIYGILSTGVHELSEDDCLRYFDSIRLGIEAILDDFIEKKKKAERKKKIISGVQEIHREINSK